MIVYEDVIQGTPEWANLRAGIPTASCFDQIVTPSGRPSQSAERYMFALLAERLMQHPITEYMSHWMDRGQSAEAEAVAFYELQRDVETVKVGFVTNDEGTTGASPDRLVGNDGLLEIKVPAEHTHVSYLLQAGAAYKTYRVQIQGQLWITQRKWSDVLSYHPEMPPALMRIERDEEFINLLRVGVSAFSRQLEELSEILRDRGWMDRPKEKPLPKNASQIMKEVLLEVAREENAG